jgi:hypothetical protein
MPITPEWIADAWPKLQPFVAEAKCAGCECLQGALIELRLALDDLPVGPEGEALRRPIAAAMQPSDRHSCLGCEPCPPSAQLAEFHREQARPASPQDTQDACCLT